MKNALIILALIFLVNPNSSKTPIFICPIDEKIKQKNICAKWKKVNGLEMIKIKKRCGKNKKCYSEKFNKTSYASLETEGLNLTCLPREDKNERCQVGTVFNSISNNCEKIGSVKIGKEASSPFLCVSGLIYNNTCVLYNDTKLCESPEEENYPKISFGLLRSLDNPSEPSSPSEPSDPSEPSSPSEPSDPSEPSSPSEPPELKEPESVVIMKENCKNRKNAQSYYFQKKIIDRYNNIILPKYGENSTEKNLEYKWGDRKLNEYWIVYENFEELLKQKIITENGTIASDRNCEYEFAWRYLYSSYIKIHLLYIILILTSII